MILASSISFREQSNSLTAYIDASNVYGSTPDEAAVLRTYRDGRLHRNSATDQLPTRQQLNLRPNTRLLRPERPEDFMAGDNRVNEHPFLAAMHVIFLREHNRIAKLLREYLPSNFQTVGLNPKPKNNQLFIFIIILFFRMKFYTKNHVDWLLRRCKMLFMANIFQLCLEWIS